MKVSIMRLSYNNSAPGTMKATRPAIRDDGVIDEELLQDSEQLRRTLKEFGMDDIFNAENNDVNIHNNDDFDGVPQVAEEYFEPEEEKKGADLEDYAEPKQDMEAAWLQHKPKVILRQIANNDSLDNAIAASARFLLVQLSEQTVFDVGRKLAEIGSYHAIGSVIAGFCEGFNQNYNLAATTGAMLYVLYVFMERTRYVKILLAIIDKSKSYNVNVFELLSFCVHFRCFSSEALCELLFYCQDLEITMSCMLICGNIVCRDAPKARQYLLDMFKRDTFQDQISQVRIRILDELLSKQQYASVFRQSYLLALENQIYNIRKQSIKFGRRMQAEYAFHGWKLADFATYVAVNDVLTNSVPKKTVFEYILDSPNSLAAFANFCIILQNSRDDVRGIARMLFERLQEQPFSAFYISAFRELINQQFGNIVKAYFYDYYRAVNEKSSNSIAYTSRLLGALLTSETPNCRISDAIRKQLLVSRHLKAKREKMFYDLTCLYCCKGGALLDNAEELSLIKYWLKAMISAGDTKKAMDVAVITVEEINAFLR